MWPVRFLADSVTIPGESAATTRHQLMRGVGSIGARGIAAEVGMAHGVVSFYIDNSIVKFHVFLNKAVVFKQLFETDTRSFLSKSNILLFSVTLGAENDVL